MHFNVKNIFIIFSVFSPLQGSFALHDHFTGFQVPAPCVPFTGLCRCFLGLCPADRCSMVLSDRPATNCAPFSDLCSYVLPGYSAVNIQPLQILPRFPVVQGSAGLLVSDPAAVFCCCRLFIALRFLCVRSCRALFSDLRSSVLPGRICSPLEAILTPAPVRSCRLCTCIKYKI